MNRHVTRPTVTQHAALCTRFSIADNTFFQPGKVVYESCEQRLNSRAPTAHRIGGSCLNGSWLQA